VFSEDFDGIVSKVGIRFVTERIANHPVNRVNTQKRRPRASKREL
jgi:hypothetical protein